MSSTIWMMLQGVYMAGDVGLPRLLTASGASSKRMRLGATRSLRPSLRKVACAATVSFLSHSPTMLQSHLHRTHRRGTRPQRSPQTGPV